MGDVLETVRALSEEIGPRPPGSEAERRASRWIAERFRAMGLTPWIQEFRGATTWTRPAAAIYAASALAAALMAAGVLPKLGAALALLAVPVFVLEARRSEVVGRSLPQSPGQNVLTQIRPTGEAVRRAIVSARCDSGAAPGRLGRFVQGRFHLWGRLAAAPVGLAALSGALSLLPGAAAFAPALALPAFAASAAAVGALLARERAPRSAGAFDDASGVAALLELADRLRSAPLANTEVWLLAAGSGRAGMIGIARMIEHYPKEREGAYFLVLDRVGAGDLRYVPRERVLEVRAADPELLAAAEAVAREKPALGLRRAKEGLFPTDAFVPMIRGHKAMALTAVDQEENPVGDGNPFHKAVDPAAILRAAEAARAILEKIDAKPR